MKRDNAELFPKPEKEPRPHTADPTTGILPYQDIEQLILDVRVSAPTPIEAAQIQPASLDLRLGATAYRVRASFLPGKSSVSSKIERLRMHEIDLSRPTVFEKGCVYIVELMEALNLPPDISGKANPKSTTGRLDIFTRLIVDGGTEFEGVPKGYRGKLYLEIVPRTFSVLAQQGARLNQLRFVRGNPPPSDAALERINEAQSLVYSDSEDELSAVIKNKALWITVDLDGSASSGLVGFRAKKHAPLIDLSKVGYYDPLEFWEPIRRTESRNLVLNPDDFYILVSRERILIPATYAASMVPYDPSIGEFRIHYAGFFDPGFGMSSDIAGARAVLEVRSHEVPFLIEHGQEVGRLIYERLLGTPQKIYGVDIGSSYQSQGLALSKQFKPLTVPD